MEFNSVISTSMTTCESSSLSIMVYKYTAFYMQCCSSQLASATPETFISQKLSYQNLAHQASSLNSKIAFIKMHCILVSRQHFRIYSKIAKSHLNKLLCRAKSKLNFAFMSLFLVAHAYFHQT